MLLNSFKMIKKYNILILALLLLQITCEAQQKNVLLIIVDDLRPELNCYGQAHMHTPNIDALAQNGVLFKNAHVQQAVCPASRASFLSAARPEATGTDYPYSSFYVNEFLYWNPTLQKHFYQSGYHSSTWGKVHHGGYKDKKNKDISLRAYKPPGTLKYALPENLDSTKKKKAATESATVHDTAYRDGLITKNATAEMKSIAKKGNPFFMAVGYHKPHLPFAAPKKYWDLYDRDQIPLSPSREKPENSPDFVLAHTALRNYAGESDENAQQLSEAYARELRHGYFACVSYIDAQVGLLVSSLKENGLYENTIIVLMSDHGWHLGDNGMWGKSTNYERATQIPLIVSNYNDLTGSRTQLVEAVDVFPTLCDLVNISTPSHTEGHSFKAVMEQPDRAWKKAVFSQYPRASVDKNLEGFAVRTPEYRYVEWRNKESNTVVARELYDHKTDPYETKNIAYEPNMASVVKTHASILSNGWKESLPIGTRNESNNPIAPPTKRYRKNDPYILTQRRVSIAVNHTYTIGLEDLNLVIDRNDSFPSGFSVFALNGDHYKRAKNEIRPEVGFQGWLEIPIYITDTNENKSNTFLFRMEVRPPITSAEKAFADRVEIEILYAENDFQQRVTQSFILPETGPYGSSISWTSSDSSLISHAGNFHNTLEGFKVHEMKARVINDTARFYKGFQLRLVPLYEDAQVYPNPNDGNFTVYNHNAFSRIEILDGSGRRIVDELFEPSFYRTMSLSGMGNGYYQIVLHESGTAQVRKVKLMIQSR